MSESLTPSTPPAGSTLTAYPTRAALRAAHAEGTFRADATAQTATLDAPSTAPAATYVEPQAPDADVQPFAPVTSAHSPGAPAVQAAPPQAAPAYQPAPPQAAPAYQAAPPELTSAQQTAPGYQPVPTSTPYAAYSTDTTPLWALPTEPEKASARLGIVALVFAVLALLIGVTWAVLNGQQVLGIVQAHQAAGTPLTTGSNTVSSDVEGFGLTVLASIAVCSLLGLAAFILGIVAIAKKRGRAQGVVALVLSVLAPALSFIAYTLSVAIAAHA